MELREVEEALEELESRIERLRALYEQYFMGIEKLEPQIPRKDVERRIWLLRREQIRNTGLRFKFQMLIQRYNTFQQYWGRTTREIETGTYRRDVLRAAQRFGDKAATTILGKRRAERYARLAEAQRAQKEGRAQAPANGAGLEPRTSDSGEWTDVDVDESVPPPGSVAQVVAARKPAEPHDPDAARRKVAALAAQLRAQRAQQEEMVRHEGPLDLDLDLDTRRPPARRSLTPSNLDRPGRRPSSGRMKAVQIPPAPGMPSDLGPPPRRRSSSSMRAVKPPPAADPSTVAAPAPPAPPPRPAVAPRAPPRAAADDANLPEQRIRQIYAKYVETKRASNESTAGVTYEKLAESLRAQAEKLRAAHPARKVDYEVVVKDGKTLLKPILR